MSKLKLIRKEVNEFKRIINAGYNSNKTLVKCLTLSCQLKALSSTKGNKVEKLCATYMLVTPNLTENIPLLFTVSWVMQMAKIKRVGLKQAVIEDILVDGVLYALNYKELSKPVKLEF